MKHHCLTNDLIKVAKLDPHLAHAICEESHDHLSDYNIAKLTLPEVIHRFGGTAAANVDMRKASDSGFQDNSTNSKGPGGVPDKQFPFSSYGDSYDSCVVSLSKITNSEVAKEECARTYRGIPPDGKKTASWTTPQITTNPNTAIRKTEGRRIVAANKTTNNDWITYGQNVRSMNGNEEPEIPAYALGVGGRPIKELYNAPHTSTLKGAALDEAIAYHEAITEPIADVLRHRAEARDNHSRVRNAAVKVKLDSHKPYWAIACNL